MRVTRLALDHYRSWDHCLVDFDGGVNVLAGHNGLGKTNIVEAVEFLATGASARASSHTPLIQRGQASATVRANVIGARVPGVADGGAGAAGAAGGAGAADGATTYALTIPARGSVRARVGEGPGRYLRDVVGQVRCVAFSPLDQLLVVQEPARRRAFLDTAGAQLIPGYYAHAQQYARLARQRAALLKRIGEDRARGAATAEDLGNLETWTADFVTAGLALTRDRAAVASALADAFTRAYASLSGGGEARIGYAPGFAEMRADPAVAPVAAPADAHEAGLAEAARETGDVRAALGVHFQRLFEGEVAQGRNLIGPHKDDLVVLLDGVPAREYASNGESWSLAVALKMALFEALGASGPSPPILILDDVFAQLDAARRAQIMDAVAGRGQTLITVAALGDVPGGGRGATVIDVEEVARRPW